MDIPASSHHVSGGPLGDVATLIDGGDMDCGSGLLLLITRAMRRLEPGDILGIRSSEAGVVTDLPVWAELVGHDVTAAVAETAAGPWWFAVRKTGAIAGPSTVFSLGSRTPVGHRLWAYTNFDCNLACLYCCAESSPKADSRRLDPVIAKGLFADFAASGGRELLLTGGEPFMHPDLGALVEAGTGLERTILTNAMVFGRGRRRDSLEAHRRRSAVDRGDLRCRPRHPGCTGCRIRVWTRGVPLCVSQSRSPPEHHDFLLGGLAARAGDR